MIGFTCGDTKILSNIKMSQKIMTRIVVLPWDDQSSFLKKNILCYAFYTEILPKHTAWTCTNKIIYLGKHLTGLHCCYKTKNKKSPGYAMVDDKNETAMKSNCTGVGNAATNLIRFM